LDLRKLEENLGSGIVDFDNNWTSSLEVLSVQTEEYISSHGLLPSQAKGAAETLKFNMALILLLVCRNTITCLRSAKLSSFVPFDDNINFHMVGFSLRSFFSTY